MSFERPTRLELAVHEAGHAYAFAGLIPFEEPEELGLATNAQGEHHGWCRRRTVLLREVDYGRLAADVRPSFEWQAEVETAIALAGPLAEFRHRHRSRLAASYLAHRNADRFLRPEAFDNDGDFQRIRDSLAHVATPDPLATLKRMIDVADEVLATNWPKVRRLARLLFERGHLAQPEIENWFAQQPATPYHHPLRAT